MIKAVLFDLDGTLLNRDESVKRFIDDQYDRLNNCLGHIQREEYMTRFIELEKHGYVWKDKVYSQLVEEFKITEVSWEGLLADYISSFKNHCVPFPNLIPMLEELKRTGYKIGMITNGYGQFQMDNVQALGIENYFDTILISEWEGIKKPDAQIFKRALMQLNVTAMQAVFIGDHPVNDILASRNAGMTGIWKRDLHWDENTELVVDDLKELPSIIEKVNRETIS